MVNLVTSPTCDRGRCLALHADKPLYTPALCNKTSVAAAEVGEARQAVAFGFLMTEKLLRRIIDGVTFPNDPMDAEYRVGSVPMAVQLLCAEVARSEGSGAQNRPNVVAACLSAIFALMTRDVTTADEIDVRSPRCLELQANLGAGAPECRQMRNRTSAKAALPLEGVSQFVLNASASPTAPFARLRLCIAFTVWMYQGPKWLTLGMRLESSHIGPWLKVFPNLQGSNVLAAYAKPLMRALESEDIGALEKEAQGRCSAHSTGCLLGMLSRVSLLLCRSPCNPDHSERLKVRPLFADTEQISCNTALWPRGTRPVKPIERRSQMQWHSRLASTEEMRRHFSSNMGTSPTETRNSSIHIAPSQREQDVRTSPAALCVAETLRHAALGGTAAVRPVLGRGT